LPDAAPARNPCHVAAAHPEIKEARMQKEYHQHVYRPPEAATDILLIRHGQSEAARAGQSFPLVGGHGDPALHANGLVQAEAVGARLRGAPLAALYVTTLRRTHQTAAPLAAHLGLSPEIEPDLREVFLGDWDGGRYRIMAAQNHPAFARARDGQEWGEIPGAETTAALHRRVRAGLLRIAARHPGQRIAAVVHGGVIGAAIAIATGAGAFAFNGAANGSISRIVIDGEKMTVRGFNDCAHLD
jgi:2,3-bisphosphoglycerate-dependent phosphoglycerate mutase